LTRRIRPSGVRAGRALALAVAGSLAAAGTAAAATSQTVRSKDAVARSCHDRFVDGAKGADAFGYTAPADGLVRARLAGGGDWDVAVFDARTGRAVAASAGFASDELAEGYVTKGQALRVQACRYRGDAGSAAVSVDTIALGQDDEGVAQLLEVDTPARADKKRLQALNLDLTEHGGADSLEVVAYGEQDLAALRQAGFTYAVKVADLGAQARRFAAEDAAYAAAEEQSGLPSGSTGYRRLADYELEMKQLALRYPALVRPLTLEHKTLEGRSVHGIEIATNPNDLGDGKPIFLNMGVHHAREWPASEHSLEWAYDLLTNYGKSARTTRLVKGTRNIVVPIVNPDGFNVSREAPTTHSGPTNVPVNREYRRKNCRLTDGQSPAAGACAAADMRLGVDPNRNYGTYWGGPGASTNPIDQTYRGAGPFSEPESQNIRELVAARQVTNLITNHTYSNLVLRPPGIREAGFPIDEPVMQALGARMTGHNGYANDPSFKLYDTTGGTEDWTYWTAGGLGYTFEIGPSAFHPPYQTGVVAEYLGLAPSAGAGKGGNREAYYEMLEATADAGMHSVIEGSAPPHWKLEVSKEFVSETSPVWQDDAGLEIAGPIRFEDRLTSTYDSKGGAFEWHVNPSTRPYVDDRLGQRPALGPPQAPVDLVNPPGTPPPGTGFANAEWSNFFEVKAPPEADNALMVIDVRWRDKDDDWDLYLAKGNTLLAVSGLGDTNAERIVYRDPQPGTDWRILMLNYSQTAPPSEDWTARVSFQGPTQDQQGTKEAWTLSCFQPNGKLHSLEQVQVARGERADVGKTCQKDKKGKGTLLR
jgi:hypothetical protein